MKKSKNRILNQAITLGLIGIAAVATWLNNEKKEQKPTANSPKTAVERPSTNHLGNYDTVMARDKIGQNLAPVDYYMLALSWSPSFCEEQKQKNGGNIPKHLQFQCNQAARLGWVIHGLWPQNANARSYTEHPRFCQGDLPMLPSELITQYLPEAPGARLLQGQWEKHGACAFNTAENYFAKQKALFRELNLPGNELSHKALFQWLKKYNPQLKNARLKANRNELYICYDKQWNVINCP